MSRSPLRLVIGEAEERLVLAGVPSPRVDAELLAAHVVGQPRSRLALVPLVDQSDLDSYRALVERRVLREPLQQIIGSAPMGAIDVAVGPGVFVPRFETELLVQWALAALTRRGSAAGGSSGTPVVLDLCTGSAALALAIAHERPDAVVYAVDRDVQALGWARRNADARANAGDTPVHVMHGDVTDRDLLTRLEGAVDVIVANPPYVPVGTTVEPEVLQHDPHDAVFAGADGLEVIRPMVSNIARWLRIGGEVGVEHDETNGAETAELFRARRVFGDVDEQVDLAGRPRFVVARRVATDAERGLLRGAASRGGRTK